MKLLIIGAGETGYHVAHELSEEHLEVTVVDENPVQLQTIQKELNVACVRGNGTSLSVLEEAGIAEADMVVASTDQDETNLICCLLAGHYNVPRSLAITKTESFSRRNVISRYLESGISQIVNSSMVTAKEILDTAAFASAAEVSAFGEKNVLLIGYRVKAEGPLDQVALKDIRGLAMEQQFLIASIVRGGESFIPGGADVIRAGDYVYLLLPKQSIGRLNEFLRVQVATNRRAVVCGGGQVARLVVDGLLKSHYEVTQIIGDDEHPQIKRQVLNKRTFHLVRGAAESVKLQLQLDVPVSALFIAAAGSDHVNLAAAVSAHYLGAKKTIALINREDVALAARAAEIDGVVSPRLLTARRVRHALYHAESVANFTTISETNMEVHEMVAGPGAEILGTPLKDLKLPPDSLVGALVRGKNQALIPDGNTVIEAGNQVVMLTLPEWAGRLREMVEGKK